MKIVMKDIFLKLMFNMIKNYNDLPFLPEKMKIEQVANLHDKKEYVIHVRNLKGALLNHELLLKKVQCH